MEAEKGQVAFEQVFYHVCGIDVHNKVLVATIRGNRIKEDTRSFNSFTEHIEGLRDWLKQKNIRHVTMESTGVYWSPVFNLL